MNKTTLFLTAAGFAGVLLASSIGRAHEGHDHGTQRGQKPAALQHGAQQAHEAAKPTGFQRSLRALLIPEVTLQSADTRPMRLTDVLAANGPVMLDFMHTACTSACAPVSEAFSRMPQKIGKEGARLRMISISVDPQNDTPARLKDYAKKYGAGPNWQFLTGSADDLEAVRRAFDDGHGAKTIDRPVAYLRRSPSSPWVRIDGAASAEDLARELRDAGEK
jgi:protein SCO1/2